MGQGYGAGLWVRVMGQGCGTGVGVGVLVRLMRGGPGECGEEGTLSEVGNEARGQFGVGGGGRRSGHGGARTWQKRRPYAPRGRVCANVPRGMLHGGNVLEKHRRQVPLSKVTLIRSSVGTSSVSASVAKVGHRP